MRICSGGCIVGDCFESGPCCKWKQPPRAAIPCCPTIGACACEGPEPCDGGGGFELEALETLPLLPPLGGRVPPPLLGRGGSDPSPDDAPICPPPFPKLIAPAFGIGPPALPGRTLLPLLGGRAGDPTLFSVRSIVEVPDGAYAGIGPVLGIGAPAPPTTVWSMLCPLPEPMRPVKALGAAGGASELMPHQGLGYCD